METKQVIAMGGALFAASMLIMVGCFNIINGLIALIKGGNYYLFTQAGVTVFNLTTWGWIFLIIGILQVGAGIAIFGGMLWARIVGIVLAILNAVGQLAYMGTYPWWSLIIITIDVVVIYSLAVMPNPNTL